MNTLRNFNSLLNSRDRATLGLLAVLMVIGGLFEVLGIGLLFPYVSILQDPSQISSNAYLRMVYDALGFTSTKAFSIALSFGLLAVFVVKGGFNIWMNKAQIRFICALQARLGETLLSDYLSQPYRFFLSANTATLISNLTTALSRMCSGLVQAALTLASEGIVVLGLVGFLIYVNPGFSLGAVLFVGLLSLAFIRLARARVAHYGQQTEVQWVSMIRTVNEAVGSVKEVQTLGRSRYFIDTYANAARVFSWAVGRNMLFSQLARVILETGAVAGMVLLCVFALVLGGFGKNLFSILAVFAFATVRLVPSANRILLSWNNIVYNMSSVDVIASIRAETSQALAKLSSAGTGDRSGTELRLREALRISVESFRYPSNPQFHLRDINVVVKKGQAVAFIGHSGSGKTSLVDLILGLFQDFKGNILVDGHNIRDNIAGWRRHIGYIPQTVYMRDDTIARNVAFGIADDKIEPDRVLRAVRLAGLDRVIASQPQGLDTVVGDRGIRLSGGERQRIGIARALYNDPDLLVLDEATSALDNETERRIVDSILSLSPAKTIIVIAHRLSTVKHCDRVYLMRDGTIVDQGTFGEVAARNSDFVNPAESKPMTAGSGR